MYRDDEPSRSKLDAFTSFKKVFLGNTLEERRAAYKSPMMIPMLEENHCALYSKKTHPVSVSYVTDVLCDMDINPLHDGLGFALTEYIASKRGATPLQRLRFCQKRLKNYKKQRRAHRDMERVDKHPFKR